MSLPRMRTIPQVVQELKKQDENTAISEHYLRKLVKIGKMPHVNTGHKILICLDTISDYLQPSLEVQNEPVNGIKKIAE